MAEKDNQMRSCLLSSLKPTEISPTSPIDEKEEEVDNVFKKLKSKH